MIRDPKTKSMMSPKSQPGYYPGFSTLEQKTSWDPSTAKIIEHRLNHEDTLQFFMPHEGKILQAVLDRVMPQDDRDERHRIPLLKVIDERLHLKKFAGFINEGTAEEDLAHQMGVQGIESLAIAQFGKSFPELSVVDQESILISIKDGKPGPEWNFGPKLSPQHYWGLLIQDAVSAYYAHPFAWDEIGFGGPAYPRGYTRLTKGLPEPWEKDEVRYEWSAPEDSRSDSYEINKELFSGKRGHSQTGSQ
jgi:hypothetical protein